MHLQFLNCFIVKGTLWDDGPRLETIVSSALFGAASGGKYRPTPLSYKITFTSDTLIGRSVFEDDDPYPNLVSYEDIGGQGSVANVLIGMIVTLCFIVYITLINQ